MNQELFSDFAQVRAHNDIGQNPTAKQQLANILGAIASWQKLQDRMEIDGFASTEELNLFNPLLDSYYTQAQLLVSSAQATQ